MGSHSKARTNCCIPRNYTCGLYVTPVAAALGNGTFHPRGEGASVMGYIYERREDAAERDETLQGEREGCRFWETLRDKFLPRWPCCYVEVTFLLQLPTCLSISEALGAAG